jgi:hypothetical protein
MQNISCYMLFFTRQTPYVSRHSSTKVSVSIRRASLVSHSKGPLIDWSYSPTLPHALTACAGTVLYTIQEGLGEYRDDLWHRSSYVPAYKTSVPLSTRGIHSWWKCCNLLARTSTILSCGFSDTSSARGSMVSRLCCR